MALQIKERIGTRKIHVLLSTATIQIVKSPNILPINDIHQCFGAMCVV